MDDTQLAIKALAHYVVARGRINFRDSGATHPARRQSFTLSFTVEDAPLYDRIWRRLMVDDLTRTGRRK